MANSEELRANKEQHKAKNGRSKKSDKEIYQAMLQCIDYLKQRFPQIEEDYRLEHAKSVSFGELIKMSQMSNLRSEYDMTFTQNTIRPDGGLIFFGKKR